MAALKITGQSAEPTVTGSDAGTIYYDSDTNKLRHYNGSAWADVSPAAAALTSADLPAGSVLQVQYASKSGAVSSTGSYVDAMGAEYITITKIAGSDIYIHWSTQVSKAGAGGIYTGGSKIIRATDTGFTANVTELPASSTIASTTQPNGSIGYNYSGTIHVGQWSHTTIDTTITASALTYYYKWQFTSGSSVTVNTDSGVGIMVAMEIKT